MKKFGGFLIFAAFVLAIISIYGFISISRTASEASMSVKQVETLLSVGDMFGLSASSDLGSQGKFMLFAMMKRTGLLIAAAVCLIAGVIMKNSAKNK